MPQISLAPDERLSVCGPVGRSVHPLLTADPSLPSLPSPSLLKSVLTASLRVSMFPHASLALTADLEVGCGPLPTSEAPQRLHLTMLEVLPRCVVVLEEF